jgi:hypothetical protein
MATWGGKWVCVKEKFNCLRGKDRKEDEKLEIYD